MIFLKNFLKYIKLIQFLDVFKLELKVELPKNTTIHIAKCITKFRFPKSQYLKLLETTR